MFDRLDRRRFGRRLPALLCLLLLGALATGPDGHAAPASPKERSEQVRQAFDAGELDKIKAWAKEPKPDRWLVADRLCALGAYDAALAYARAGEGIDVKALPAYVEAQKAAGTAAERRKVLEAGVAKLRANQVQEGLAELAALQTASQPDVVQILAMRLEGQMLPRLGKPREAATLLQEAAKLAEGLGWLQEAGTINVSAATLAYRGSDLDTMQAVLEAAHAIEKRRGDKKREIMMLSNLASVDNVRGNRRQAVERYKEALAAQEALGDKHGAALTMGNLASALQSYGALEEAGPYLQKSLALREELGDELGVAQARALIGTQHSLLSRYTKALEELKVALEILKRIDKPDYAATVMGNIASAYVYLGAYPEARQWYEKTRAAKRALGNEAGAASTLGEIAALDMRLGNYERSLEGYEEALKVARRIGHGRLVTQLESKMAVTYQYLEDFEQAAELHLRSAKAFEAQGNLVSAGVSQSNLAHILVMIGKPDEAIPIFEAVAKQSTQFGNLRFQAQNLTGLGRAYEDTGRIDDARTTYDKAAALAGRARATQTQFEILGSIAFLELNAGNYEASIEASRKGLELLRKMYGGLADDEGVTVRERHANLFEVGARAGLGKQDPAAVVEFQESGRAGALLDLLGNRERMRWRAESLPQELQLADAKANEARRIAAYAADKANAGGNLKARRKALETLDKADAEVQKVTARIQRELKADASLYYPVAESVETIAAGLRDDQALVLYGLAVDRAIATVVRRTGQRIVDLCSRDEFEALCEAIDVTSPDAKVDDAIASARKQLVAPLGLGKDVKHVLVSPDSALSYVPPSLLFDRTVSLTPSGTTHLLLAEEAQQKGKGRLGVGDPDYSGVSAGARKTFYRGRPLDALPGTRGEVETVATVKLLGAQATEAGLREALAKQPRWQAVHFACHGLIDAEHPDRSSLALTKAEPDDGFLTMREILRMKIPADVAVLSACDTGRGRVARGEGIVGLTRAFMFAGCPRVICSLWKVDDEATRALMVKFYELWEGTQDKPGLPIAEALAGAQAHIRAQPKWKHPYYWSAWVLWGPGR